MEYSKIIAVTGLPGLYELINSKSDGAIVRSLQDKSSKFVSSRVHNFSHLESIEVFTIRENTNLVEVLQAMEKSSEALPDDKDPGALKNYFSKVYPDLDFQRVYPSDLKKMVKWFSVLRDNQVELKLSEAEVAEEAPVEVTKEEVPVVVEEPVKAAAKPKKAPAKKTAEKEEEAPAPKPKKAPAKKKSE